MKIINASIDLTKIDKAKIKEHQNGSKYYPITIFVMDEKDKYNNDVSIKNSQTKEEREAKAKEVYIGSGKTVWEGQSKKQQQTEQPSKNNNFDDLPF